MKRVIVNTAGQVHAYRAAITLGLLGLSAIFAIFYAVNLYSMVSHTVALRQTESAISSVSNALGELDSQYLKLSSAITPDALAEHGLSAGHVSLYIKRSAATASIPTLAQGGYEL